MADRVLSLPTKGVKSSLLLNEAPQEKDTAATHILQAACQPIHTKKGD
jgi:hypothetical protein